RGARAVDHLAGGHCRVRADAFDSASRHGDVGAAELAGADIYEAVPENKLGHLRGSAEFTNGSESMSLAASPQGLWAGCRIPAERRRSTTRPGMPIEVGWLPWMPQTKLRALRRCTLTASSILRPSRTSTTSY